MRHPLLGALLLCAAVLPALSAEEKGPSPLAKKGAKDFVQSCGFCHGEDAAGSRAPDLIRSALVLHDKDGDLIGAIIKSGRPDKGMPAFPLPAGQIASITAFLHFKADEARNSAHVSNDYPIARLLTGDAAAGKAYFNGEGKCATCHSPDNDLKGVASRYSPINLQQRFLYPGGKAGGAVTAVVTDAAGTQYKGAVTHIDEFSVALTDSEGWFHAWDRGAVKVEVNDPLAAHRELLRKYSDDDVHNLFAYLETLK